MLTYADCHTLVAVVPLRSGRSTSGCRLPRTYLTPPTAEREGEPRRLGGGGAGHALGGGGRAVRPDQRSWGSREREEREEREERGEREEGGRVREREREEREEREKRETREERGGRGGAGAGAGVPRVRARIFCMMSLCYQVLPYADVC